MRVLQRRPGNAVEIWEQGRWLHAFATADGPVLTAVHEQGSVDAPDVRLSILVGASSVHARRRIERTVRTMLGLDVDAVPLQRAAARVPALRATARALRGMRPPRFGGLFETFVNVVPFQQLSLDAGTAILGRLIERFGEHVLYGDRRFAMLPTAGSIASARLPTLVRCGLSRSKAESLRSIARIVAAGEIRQEAIAALSTRAALDVLLELPGIGPWSAAVVLLRGFGRLEVFPPGDSGAVRGLNALLRLRSPNALDRVIERFGDSRGYLYFCGLGASLVARGFIQPAPPASTTAALRG